MNNKEEWLKLIASNIEQSGHHITMVKGGTCPRFAYTIGLSASVSIELVFAGGIELMADEVMVVLNQVSQHLREGLHLKSWRSKLGLRCD